MNCHMSLGGDIPGLAVMIYRVQVSHCQVGFQRQQSETSNIWSDHRKDLACVNYIKRHTSFESCRKCSLHAWLSPISSLSVAVTHLIATRGCHPFQDHDHILETNFSSEGTLHFFRQYEEVCLRKIATIRTRFARVDVKGGVLRGLMPSS